MSSQKLIEKVKEFIQSLGNEVECREGKYNNDFYSLSGYYFGCDYRSKWFFIIIDDSGNVYIKTPFHFSKADQVLQKLSEVFNINLDRLAFSEVGFLYVFKLEPLPEDIISITTDTDEINLSTSRNNRVLIYIRNKISILYDRGTKQYIISEVKDWETYRKIRSVLDHDTREILDKLALIKPEFIIETDNDIYEEALGLEGKIKENLLKLLNKLTPIPEKINRIIVRVGENENEITLNNIVIELKDEHWEDIPRNEIEKLLKLDDHVVINVHKDFWYIRVHEVYLSSVANILGIEPIQILDPKKYSPLFYENKDYYVFSTHSNCCGNRYHIVPSINIRKYLQSIGVNVTGQNITDSFEVVSGGYKYVITKGESDEVHVQVLKDNKMTTLRTYLWYFDVARFDELKSLDKEKVITVINRQFNERYFYPMPYDKVKKRVITLIDNAINKIDQAINSIKTRALEFPPIVKDIAEIDCIFSEDCEVGLELDELGNLSSYYSLISTAKGHLPVPIFLEYIGIGESDNDEEDISEVKNVLYFIRGYKEIPECKRDQPDDNVRGASSELFQKAVVLYNKLHNDDDDCESGTLPDGMGYCRKFNYEPLMKKSEEELSNEIIQSLEKIKEKMMKIREKMLNRL